MLFRHRQPRPRTLRRAFSLLELVMVLSTAGFIAAIAVPRLTSAAGNSRIAALNATTRSIQFAIELYAAEHFDRSPAENPDGSLETSSAVIVARLTMSTDINGTVIAGGPFGPYLKDWPANPLNGKRTLRLTAAAAGTGTHGWHLSGRGRKVAGDQGATNIATVELTEVTGTEPTVEAYK